MDSSSQRKTWGKAPSPHSKDSAKVVLTKQAVEYDNYLLLLQEKNRLVKKLTKGPQQIELERKEQGFTLYVNGANTKLKRNRKKATEKRVPLTYRERQQREKERKNAFGIGDDGLRAKTAPEKGRRKNWVASSVQLKTNDGDKMRVKAPDILTGNYSEDFEISQSFIDESSEDDDSDEDDDHFELARRMNKALGGESSSDSEVDVATSQISTMRSSNQLMLSLSDIKKLRQSLATNVSIQQSLAKEEEISGPSDDDIPEFPSDEGVSDIEEDIAQVADNLTVKDNKKWKPGDMIVLEFAPKAREERSLSAARKDNSDSLGALKSDRKLGSRPTSKTSQQQPLNSGKDVVLQSAGYASKKQVRPISANRKSQKMPDADSTLEANAVLAAIKAENENVDKQISAKSTPRSPRVAPISKSPPKSQSVRNSQSASNSFSRSIADVKHSRSLTDDNIKGVVDRVLEMDPKQQKKLLDALGMIEHATEDVEATTVKESATCNVHHTLAKTNLLRSSVKQGRPSDTEDNSVIEVIIEVTSNWGHSSRVGLTEVQFFDTDSKRIELTTDNILVYGANHIKGDLAALMNGKFKTTKDRNMWSCAAESNRPLELFFTLHKPESSSSDFAISKIKIWNYNKNLNDLCMGIKGTRIFIGGELVFSGDIDKGCGNQVFDYHKAIVLNESVLRNSPRSGMCTLSPSTESALSLSPSRLTTRSPSPIIPASVRCETRTLNHSHDLKLDIPIVASVDEEKEVSFKESKVKTSRRMAANLSGSADSSLSENDSKAQYRKTPRPELPKSLQSANISVSVAASHDEPCMLEQIRQVNSDGGRSKSRNSNSNSNSNAKPMWLQAPGTPEPFDPPESRSGKNVEDGVESHLQSTLGLGNWPNRGLDDLPTILDDSNPNKTRVGSGRRSRKADGNDDDYGDAVINVTPNQQPKWYKNHPDINLEESWTSLNDFDKHQRGRLSVDMEGDVLDEYLSNNTAFDKKSKPLTTEKIEETSSEDEEFVIPELPFGKELVLDIKTTWGDKHYVGLTGIELYSSTGEPINVAKINSDPADINVLPGYDKDPRVVTNLLDGINRTRDDTHMWLAPYTKNKKHLVKLSFEKPCKIAVMRLWNYNKSRIHSFRGAKLVNVTLDGKTIFKGEISQACGGIMGRAETFGDTILFTMDEDILESVSKYDDTYEGDAFSSDEDESATIATARPKTADDGTGERPYTTAFGGEKQNQPEKQIAVTLDTSHILQKDGITVYKGQRLNINFTATWGDLHYLGLTGLEIVDKDGDAIPIKLNMVDAHPRDLTHIPGCEKDDRTLDKLINGTNITMSDESMWLIPYSEGKDHLVTINFGKSVEMTGLRLWNYNKSAEDTFRGAKIVHVRLDGKQVSPNEGYLIRKGPGNCFFDFAQEIAFTSAVTGSQPPPPSICEKNLNVNADLASQDYESVPMPCGFIYQFHLISSWGDPYYVGLNGLEFFNELGNQIELTENNISAFPDSVNVLEGVSNDIRTPDKLVNGFNNTMDGTCMWLAPVLPNVINRVYVIFDAPVTVSMIRLWNYSKTASRGVKDFGLYVDDLLVYNGTLDLVQPIARGILPTVTASQPYHTILFTSDKGIVQREKNTIVRRSPVPCWGNSSEGNIRSSDQFYQQDVQMTNDKKIVSHYFDPAAQNKKPVDQALRPTTSVTQSRGFKRFDSKK